MTRSLSGLNVTVAGAGIGGLATAISLQRRGAEVTIFERAAELAPLGAGLSLFPNAVHALRELGVAAALEASSVPRGEGGLWTAAGDPLAQEDAAELEARYGAPLLLVHRGELQEALVSALAPGTLVLGESLVALEHHAAGVRANFASGRVAESGLLVGADGLRSVVREAIVGDGEPRDSGLTAYRGVTDFDPGERVGEFWGEGGVFGLVPLSAGRVYWFATERAPEHEGDAVSDDEKRSLAERYAAWVKPLAAVVEATPAERILRHRLYDRAPRKNWTAGRATLLGDAAHPMLPFLGQGAGQALEDAVALAGALESEPSVEAALAHYERVRFERIEPLVKRSHSAGRLTHLGPAWLRGLRNAAVRRVPERARQRQLDAVIGR